MTYQPGILEHLDRVKRVRSVACPQCKRPAGKPCMRPSGKTMSIHHAVRWAALYKQEGRRS